MTGKAHRRFWQDFEKLPPKVQDLARKKYALWKKDPFHPSLGFEERRNNICVVRIGNNYRALGLREAGTCDFRLLFAFPPRNSSGSSSPAGLTA